MANSFYAVWLIVLLLVPKSEPVTLACSPRQAFEPVTVRTTTRVTPYAENRGVCVVWDSQDGEAGEHCWQIEGDQAAVTYVFDVVHVSAGEYIFQSVVITGDTYRYSAKVLVNVLSKQ